jgi:23S rRNA (cytosine1962-C5)-methyltransferase
MKTVKLKKKEERRILRGHPWVFSNEIERPAETLSPGDIVDVLDNSGRFIGRGYINPHSLIIARILTRKQEEIDLAFFRGKIKAARELRVMLGFGDSFARSSVRGRSARPHVDKYADTLVLQSSTASTVCRCHSPGIEGRIFAACYRAQERQLITRT